MRDDSTFTPRPAVGGATDPSRDGDEAADAGADRCAHAPESGESSGAAVAWESDIDLSLAEPEEMTGLWLTTELDRDSPLRLDGEPVEPEDLDLPDALADRLRDWAQMWHDDWDPERGWAPRARIADYEALGGWLARWVKDHVGAITVTLQLAHLGRSGTSVLAPPDRREPESVRLMNDYGAAMPVWGDFVTESGVGSFSAELNARLEGWAERFAEHMDPVVGWDADELRAVHASQAQVLAEAMRAELGPDYTVELELWELDASPGPFPARSVARSAR